MMNNSNRNHDDAFLRYNFHQKTHINDNFVQKCFEKKFKFNKSSNWTLPPFEIFFQTDNYQYEVLQNCKNNLNSVKNKLNDFPNEEWAIHTRKRNPAGEIAWKLKGEINAEFVTQAWCKFYECLSQYPIATDSKLNSVHLCEAPGAFIAALNHYLHSNYSNVKWNWLSSTLNPYYEGNPLSNMIQDDRFLLHTFDKWLFGNDFTGDIMNEENIEQISNTAKKLLNNSINLITADGSIDCMEVPDLQEETVYSLHYAEICTALKILSNDGCFVVKMFTLFESTTVSLLYLLNCIFKEVHVFKPATSKCGNSEVYIICINFMKNSIDYFDKFIDIIIKNINNKSIMFPKHIIPEDFIQQHTECAKFFMNCQINAIESNIQNFNKENFKKRNNIDVKKCILIRENVRKLYFEKYDIKPIEEKDKILYNYNFTIEYECIRRKCIYSFTERLSLKKKSKNDKLIAFISELNYIQNEYILKNSNNNENNNNINTTNQNTCIQIYYGKPVDIIKSSLFILLDVMELCNKLIEIDINPWIFENTYFQIYTYDEDNNCNKCDKKTNYLTYYNTINEHKFFIKIINYILIHERNLKKIDLYEMPLLTHFSVSIIKFFIHNVFEKYNIDNNNSIISFENLKNDGIKNIRKLSIEYNKYQLNENNENTILCVVDIKELHKNQFSNMIEKYNNYFMIKHINNNCLNKAN